MTFGGGHIVLLSFINENSKMFQTTTEHGNIVFPHEMIYIYIYIYR